MPRPSRAFRRGLRAALTAGLAAPALIAVGQANAAPPAPTACSDSVLPSPAAGQAPALGTPCWTEVSPYPFGDDGGPVLNPSAQRCLSGRCELGVQSFAFRAWNRGLAATSGSSAFGVWLWNGSTWQPDPTFPGTGTCPGSRILWAGKLDYWLIGNGGSGIWPRMCRFDGASFQWQPLSVPSATLARVTTGLLPNGTPVRLGGAITSGTCQAWNDCWFFGTYGTVLRWDGATLSDASPDAAQPWRWTAWSGAVAGHDAAGAPVGYAVGLSAMRLAPTTNVITGSEILPSRPDGTAPVQVATIDPAGVTPLAYAPPSTGVPGDPYRTDLVAVDADPLGRAWIAGVPRVGGGAATQPAPVIAAGRAGADPTCPGPAADRFPGSGLGTVYRWQAISALQDASGALVAGAARSAGAQPSDERPLLAQVDCAGGVTETRFRTHPLDPVQDAALGAVSAPGALRAVASTAPNDAWLAVPGGFFTPPNAGPTDPPQPARSIMLRLQDGRAPLGPAGDDNEDRPIILADDAITFVPPGDPSPPVLAKPVRPRFFGFRTRFKGSTLTLTFKVRRRGMLGIQALRGKAVVATTGLHRFGPPRGKLQLTFVRERWPTRIQILTDTPIGVLEPLPKVLRGSIRLVGRGRAIKGRKVASVRFDFSPAGQNQWREIATSFGDPPYRTSFYTGDVPDGRYDFRVVVTDSAKEEGISPVLRRTIRNAP